MAAFQKQWFLVVFVFLLRVHAKTTTGGCLLGSCGHQCLPQSLVINGDDASRGEWPWQAWFAIGPYLFVCGGALLHPAWVLTAGHCIISNDTAKYRVTLGDVDRTRNEGSEQVFGVKKILLHRDFNVRSPYDSDVALLQLNRPALLNNWVNTVCLPSRDASPGATCFMTAWGQTHSSVDVADHLQKGVMPIVSTPECIRRFQNTSIKGLVHRDSRPWQITDKMICAGNAKVGKISGCYGDSGGPLVCKNTAGKWEVQGLVGWGDHTCNAKNFFTVFTRVTKFRQWIKKNMFKKP